MRLKEETITFFIFIFIGVIIGIIFDFFRALRKVRKYKDKYIYLQDIAFFVIIGIILSLVLIYNLQDELRVYLFFAIFLGITIYVSTLSIYIVRIFSKIIQISNAIFEFIFMPLSLYKYIFMTIYDFLLKNMKKCCNKFYNVISYFYKSIKLKIHRIK